tara:strand:- start:27926 stop:28309 length:384 start_codon:yes stop_codon:yes gene_type:complete
MAFVVLLSTMSYTIDMHYCGDTMVDFSFFHEVETCGMEKTQVAISCENPTLSQNSCCSDEKLVIDGQNDLKDTFNNLDFQQQIFIVAFTNSYISLFEGTNANQVPFGDYSPPFVKRDVQALHQTFLI